jgi:hypothetical protein
VVVWAKHEEFALLPASPEIQEWCSILELEMMRWPGVSMGHNLERVLSVVAPELAELEKKRESHRYAAQESMVELLEGHLQPGITTQGARDIIWALTGRALYRMFVRSAAGLRKSMKTGSEKRYVNRS